MKRWFGNLNIWLKFALFGLILIVLFWAIKSLFFTEPQKSQFVTAKVARMNLEQSVLATGVVEAYKQVTIGAQVSGQIKSLKVVMGQKVKKGELLAIIDADKQVNALQSAKAELYSSEATMLSKQATLHKAKLDFDRQSMMISSGATSKQEYDSAKAALALAKADITQSKALIEKAKINVETSQVSLEYTNVISPIDGVVVAIAVEEGQTVNANQITPTLMIIADLSKMTIKAEISEGDVVKISDGMSAKFNVLGDAKRVYNAKIRSIDPAPTTMSDSAKSDSSLSGTPIYYYAMLDVPNSDNRLRISMTTEITIFVKSIKNALTIPALALGSERKKGYEVKVLTKDKDDEKVTTKVVKIGLNNGVDVEVLSGLKDGEEVVVSEEDVNSKDKKQSASEAMSKRRMSSAMGS